MLPPLCGSYQYKKIVRESFSIVAERKEKELSMQTL